jgi:hypothetical protein
MNERIQELARKANMVEVEYSPGFPDIRYPKNFEKFAELIVRECMSMCDEQRAYYFGHRMASDDFIDKNMYAEGEAACDILQYKMKKHFGVEE